jgi:hypothetical protein
MDNRIIFGQTFISHYFDPTKSIRKNKKNESHIDFYIFYSGKVSISEICAFHVPYSYVYEYSHSSFHSEEEAFIVDILLHQRVVEIKNKDSDTEELYNSLLEYFCYGEDFYFTIDSQPKGGFGLIALFDETYSKPTITSIIEPEVNKDRFYL